MPNKGTNRTCQGQTNARFTWLIVHLKPELIDSTTVCVCEFLGKQKVHTSRKVRSKHAVFVGDRSFDTVITVCK